MIKVNFGSYEFRHFHFLRLKKNPLNKPSQKCFNKLNVNIIIIAKMALTNLKKLFIFEFLALFGVCGSV